MKKEIEITTEYIKLDQLLKFSGISGTGSSAKEMILSGIVSVNGKVCLLRGKKIRKGDAISIDKGGETIEMTVV
ncbi:MAG: RNA-binding S4 domain-containing protein [Firmicutes bacterium]|nr:RNA-binding S4 domain-containing protein [Bacillota bacterium]